MSAYPSASSSSSPLRGSTLPCIPLPPGPLLSPLPSQEVGSAERMGRTRQTKPCWAPAPARYCLRGIRHCGSQSRAENQLTGTNTKAGGADGDGSPVRAISVPLRKEETQDPDRKEKRGQRNSKAARGQLGQERLLHSRFANGKSAVRPVSVVPDPRRLGPGRPWTSTPPIAPGSHSTASLTTRVSPGLPARPSCLELV